MVALAIDFSFICVQLELQGVAGHSRRTVVAPMDLASGSQIAKPSPSRVLRATRSEGDPPFNVMEFVGIPAIAGAPPVVIQESDCEVDSADSDVEMAIDHPQLDFMEVFSPPRVFFPVIRRGLLAEVQCSMDLTKGFDFLTVESRAACLQALKEKKPRWVNVSPPCTMYSPLQQLFNLKKMSESQKRARFQEADNLLDFGMHLCRIQSAAGRYFLFEHPARASSWERPSVKQALELPGTFLIAFDQCRTGLVSPGDNPKPIKKRTILMSNAAAVRSIFAPLQCTCEPGAHQVIEGSIDGVPLSKWAQHYPPALCEAMADAVAQTVGRPAEIVD